MSIDIEQVEQMEPQEFAAWVGSLTDDELRGITGSDRERLLDYVFGAIPDAFQADRAAGGSPGSASRSPATATRIGMRWSSTTARAPRRTWSRAGVCSRSAWRVPPAIVGTANPVTMVMLARSRSPASWPRCWPSSAGSEMPRAETRYATLRLPTG